VELDERSVNTLMTVQTGGGAKNLLNEPITGYVYMGDETSLVFYMQGWKSNLYNYQLIFKQFIVALRYNN